MLTTENHSITMLEPESLYACIKILASLLTVLCVGDIKVLLFPLCTLQRCKCAVFAQVPENTAHLDKYNTLAKYSKVIVRVDY